MTTSATLKKQALRARAAARKLATSSTEERNAALFSIAAALDERCGQVLDANAVDLTEAERAGLGEHITERMTLNEERVGDMAGALGVIARLPDPIGEVLDETTRPNGLRVQRISVPLGVIGTIYESRPNVTVDIASLCLKSGNAVILRGGKEAFNTNKALVNIITDSLDSSDLPADAVQFVASTDRALVRDMLAMKDEIDLMVPRGSAELVHFVAETAAMPAVTGGIGVCHTFVDSAADLEKAREIVVNAKVQRPTVCNALDTVLVDSAIAGEFLPDLAREFAGHGVEMRCDRRTLSILHTDDNGADLKAATEEDFGTEFLDLIASVKIVDGLDEALSHIGTYGSGHSEAIVTEDVATAEAFISMVDAAAVFTNASTRFNDGGEFGLGAEVAISTNKLHARGPMGLRELTSYKWVVRGDGQIRT